MLAGPSEVLILADDDANPKIVAADMIAQVSMRHMSHVCIYCRFSLFISHSKLFRNFFSLSLRRSTTRWPRPSSSPPRVLSSPRLSSSWRCSWPPYPPLTRMLRDRRCSTVFLYGLAAEHAASSSPSVHPTKQRLARSRTSALLPA